jgi:hypothetical protein
MTNTVKTGIISALIRQKSEIFASFPQGKPFAPLCGARRPQGRRIMNRVNNNLLLQKVRKNAQKMYKILLQNKQKGAIIPVI